MEQETVLVASFAHETNTFSTVPTDRSAFKTYREYFGEEVVEQFRGTNTATGGVIEFAEEEEIDLVPVIAASASPSGRVTTETYNFYVDYILDSIAEHIDDTDGIALPLHGAMVPAGKDAGEGPLVSRIRELVGPDIPIVVTLDLHGNLSDELIDHADAVVAYETYPHVDMAETGYTGMKLLIDTVRGTIDPTMHIERPPVLPHEPFEDTNHPPMSEVMNEAR